MKIGKLQARSVVEDLKTGSPNEEFLELYSCAEGQSFLELKEYIDDVAEGNYTIVRFLKGDYGSGKSHTLSRLEQHALCANDSETLTP